MPNELLAAAALTGRATVSVLFLGARAADLDCAPTGMGGVCAPSEEAAPHLAAELARARSVTLRLTTVVPGMAPFPEQRRVLSLSRTQDALARLRAAGPTPMPEPATALASQSPAGLAATADRWLKAAGYPDGITGVKALVDRYRGAAK
ncbi:MAG TPA: hypothetical protein VE690_20175 [Rhodopila sp.]|nr:hypothetical protein [Rhodopila sp.]